MSDQPAPAGAGPATPASRFVLGDKEFVPLTLDRVRQLFANRYDVVRELGSGGTAIVYLAHDREQDRRIAIKVLRPELSAAVIAARFLREIEIGKQLIHPNVLPIEEWGTVEGELYCTMPFVDGETLQERMARETHLPLSEALRISRAVAGALDCAHQAGLIHRDIKPGNILLSGDRVFVADFGIARAMSAAATSGLTDSGIVIGTAPYMSPEQGSAEKSLDGRTDIYSLGCVVYEMLGGEPPFTGPTARAIIARHAHEAPRSLRVIRPAVPLGVQRAVEKALAKVPADRFATAGEFAGALDRAAAQPDEREPRGGRALAASRRHPVWAALGVAAVAGAAWWSAKRVQTSREAATLAMLDTTRYVVVAGDTLAATQAAAAAVREALGGWSGITVVEALPQRQVSAPNSGGLSALADSDARLVATRANAGRLVRVQAKIEGDSVRVHGTLMDIRTASLLADASIRGTKPERAPAVAAGLVERLLFPNALGLGAIRSDSGTHSVPARQAYLRGQVAVADWHLELGDSAFRRATELDPKYAAAALWLAQVRQWSLAPVTQWQFAADQALANDSSLTRPARMTAQALAELARGRRDVACAHWAELTRVNGDEFVPWYSLGNCLRYDSLVVRDPRSRSGWRFRTSYQTAINAYLESYRRFPLPGGSLSDAWFRDVRELLGVKGPKLRAGRLALPDSTAFLAVQSWHADTIQFTPYPQSEFYAAREARSSAERDAITRGRQQLLQLAQMWRTRLPGSAVASEAVAIALELLGNASAFDTLRAVRRGATTDADRLRLAALEVWLRVKHSMPDDLAGLRIARALADSILADSAAAAHWDARTLASLAALTGRATNAARYARMGGMDGIPPGMESVAPSLLVYAALGGPRDSIRAYGSALAAAVEQTIPLRDRAMTRARWQLRAASLAAPDPVLNETLRHENSNSFLEQLLDAWRRNDRDATRSLLLDLKRRRSEIGARPADVTVDVAYSEAAILAAVGDTLRAIDWLDSTLPSLSAVSPDAFADLTRSAALVRAMALRAWLAGNAGDARNARRWARAALTLWSGADAALLPVVERLRTLAER